MEQPDPFRRGPRPGLEEDVMIISQDVPIIQELNQTTSKKADNLTTRLEQLLDENEKLRIENLKLKSGESPSCEGFINQSFTDDVLREELVKIRIGT